MEKEIQCASRKYVEVKPVVSDKSKLGDFSICCDDCKHLVTLKRTDIHPQRLEYWCGTTRWIGFTPYTTPKECPLKVGFLV